MAKVARLPVPRVEKRLEALDMAGIGEAVAETAEKQGIVNPVVWADFESKFASINSDGTLPKGAVEDLRDLIAQSSVDDECGPDRRDVGEGLVRELACRGFRIVREA